MIYFDNAATTLKKPSGVARAMINALEYGGNSGRGGHKAALWSANAVYDCRVALADFFGLSNPEQVVFCYNATHAINMAVKTQLYGGGHVVISGYEHNSVVRPLVAMAEKGVSYTVAHSPLFDEQAAYSAIENALQSDTKCVVMTHVSNVFGFILPIEEVNELCMRRGIALIVDASQSAGVLPIDMSRLTAAQFICMPAHKSLYGPQGLGVLLCRETEIAHTIIEGGTGSVSSELSQPSFLPDALESGTPNIPGICGLREGLRFIERHGLQSIYRHERQLVEYAAQLLGQIPGVEVFLGKCQTGVLSVVSKVQDSETLCHALGKEGICARGGLHCSPISHKSANTLPEGTVRLSFSMFNTKQEILQFFKTFNRVIDKKVY